MAFKNAFKIFISKFSLVWVLALFITVLGLIIGATMLPFIVSMVNAVRRAGIDEMVYSSFQNLLDGKPLSEISIEISLIFESFQELFATDKAFSFTPLFILAIIITFVYRFLLGFYELPLLRVLEGSMSSNAKIGFFGSFISQLSKSAKFVLLKIIYTLLFDAVIYVLITLMFNFFKIPVLSVFAPFIIMAVLIALLSLRYTLIAMWAPSVALGEQKIAGGFIFSVKKCCRNFRSVYATFAIAWILIIPVNIFIGIFTLGAGLLASIPMSMLFVSIINMAVYYNKNNKRYYVDGTVYTPPTIE